MKYRTVLPAAVLVITLAGTGAVHAMSDREKARLIMLDQCVEGSAKRGNEFSEFAETCRCGASKAAKKLSDSEVASVISAGRVRGSASRVWNDTMKACK